MCKHIAAKVAYPSQILFFFYKIKPVFFLIIKIK